ncbi:MAG: helix-turn-helix domain-containing protein [Thermoanaerobaculia bacterium]
MTTASSRIARATERHRIERAIELYLRECFRKPTVARVSELAALFGANRTYLSRVVPRVLGEPLGRALRRRQLTYAERLLRETDLPIEDVASAAAFGTARTFFRAFSGAFGMTPGAWRKKATKCQ